MLPESQVLKPLSIEELNTCMHRYQVQARVNGTWIKTIIFADNDLHARLIAQYQFGHSNVPFAPTKIG